MSWYVDTVEVRVFVAENFVSEIESGGISTREGREVSVESTIIGRYLRM